MVKYMLKIAADLENLTRLQPEGGCDDPSFFYLFKLKCERCGELTRKETCVSLGYTVHLLVGKCNRFSNLVPKCKLCLRIGTVTMISGRGIPLTQEESEAGQYAPLMLFECSGYEPVGFVFAGGWKVESLKGTTFEGLDLARGDFAEYDQMGSCPVTISNLRYTFDVME
ncbi:hypothetical protein DITRI_Ditri10aG0111800 [Diplodiscus trichospermus]